LHRTRLTGLISYVEGKKESYRYSSSGRHFLATGNHMPGLRCIAYPPIHTTSIAPDMRESHGFCWWRRRGSGPLDFCGHRRACVASNIVLVASQRLIQYLVALHIWFLASGDVCLNNLLIVITRGKAGSRISNLMTQTITIQLHKHFNMFQK